MSIQITARHTEIDDFTRERIETKADKLRRFFDRIKETLDDISKVAQNYRFEGRRLTMTLMPDSKKV